MTTTKDTWDKAQEWEKDWHGTSVNSFNEERKQLDYAQKMGLKTSPTHKTPYNFDLEDKSILDIGGGAYSLLLKCVNFKKAVIVEPIKHVDWVLQRYKTHGVDFWNVRGEDLDKMAFQPFTDESIPIFDEVWFYNVLEHVEDPEQIVKNARAVAKIVRVFEWLYTPPNIGHPQTLTEENMNKWLGGEGKIHVAGRGAGNGTSYSGVFKGDHYGEV